MSARVPLALGLLVALPAVALAQVRPAAVARPAAEVAPFRRVVAREFARHPRMEPQDVYKLAFQAALGSRHFGLDSAMAAEWLAREVATLGDGPREPMLDTIAPDVGMVRVNLRPYLASGGDREALLRAFLRTAREFRGSSARLRRCLAEVERMAAAGEVPLARSALHAYFQRMRAQGYPAVEHSVVYETAYRPAYRVVLGAFLPPAGAGAP